MNSERLSLRNKIALSAAVGLWVAFVCLWMAKPQPTFRLGAIGLPNRYILVSVLFDIVFGLAALGGIWFALRGRRLEGRARYSRYTLAFPLLWQAAVYFADRFYFSSIRASIADAGLAVAYLVGLCWLVWYVERRWNEHLKQARHHAFDDPGPRKSVSDPFNPAAWYYGRHNGRLVQSLLLLTNYTLVFMLLCFLSSQMGGCQEIYERAAGGGKQAQRAQKVKIQKVIKKKYVINPYSSIIMSVRKIDDVKMNLKEMTANQYVIGQGSGDGAGYGGKNPNAKTRFIRLEYSGGDWDQDFGIGADLNLLIQFAAQTGGKVAEQTESRTIGQLGNFKLGNAPPLVYMTGQRSISLTKGEVKILRDYLIENHGMIFIDNGGSSHFHNQAFAMMRLVTPEIEPVKVPLDDVIHTIPNPIPFLPYVSPHGGRDAYGWKLDGRWIAYYHPGDIGDAWADGHAAVPQQVWEACYDLGVNIIHYANSEQAKWDEARHAAN